MAGYQWYDGLSRITGIAFEIEQGDTSLTYAEPGKTGLDTGVVDRLDLILTFGGEQTETIVIPAPILIEYDDGSCWNYDEAIILFTDAQAITPDDLTELSSEPAFPRAMIATPTAGIPSMIVSCSMHGRWRPAFCSGRRCADREAARYPAEPRPMVCAGGADI
ncbi:hypothetical protein GCM10020258_51720 [Sphingomonas yabuuchiae]